MHRVRHPLARREDDDEREEVQRERYHPQQRNGRDVGGYIGRYPQHQARRHERQPHPPGPAQPGRPTGETARRGFQGRVRGEPPPLTGSPLSGSPLRDSASSSSWAGAAGAERHNITAEAKTSTTSSPYPTDHHRPWLESVNSRSTTSG